MRVIKDIVTIFNLILIVLFLYYLKTEKSKSGNAIIVGMSILQMVNTVLIWI